MVVPIASTCAGAISTNLTSTVVPAAKRTAAPEGGSPAWKARRVLLFNKVSHSVRMSTKTSGELLEPTDTDALEDRLRFVSPTEDAADLDTDATLSGLVRQMNGLDIAYSGSPKSRKDVEQSAMQQEDVKLKQPTTNPQAPGSDRSSVATSRSGVQKGAWRFWAHPGSFKDIHTTEEDGWQIVEGYGEKTPPRHSPSPSPERTLDAPEGVVTALPGVIAPSRCAPHFSREDTPDHFQWLVANMPYPTSTYDISVDSEKQQIVIKTINRKYYKRIDLPELVECGLPLDEKLLTWKHCQDTLIVSYVKPAA